MDGYAFAVALCFICGKPFTFNPHKVPSIRDEYEVKQPICATCVSWVQAEQKRRGVPVWADPLPGVYDPLPEKEL